MATEEVKKETTETATNGKGKGLLQVPEVRMLLYVIPVAAILLVLALVLS
jgi:hypothetical protein